MCNEIGGDIGQRHSAGRPRPFQRTERDQPVTAADVQNGFARPDVGVVEYPIADRQQMFERLRSLLLIPTIAPLEEPRRPLVEIAAGHVAML